MEREQTPWDKVECPACNGDNPKCEYCEGEGEVPESVYNAFQKEQYQAYVFDCMKETFSHFKPNNQTNGN